jgi:hypothetical protein
MCVEKLRDYLGERLGAERQVARLDGGEKALELLGALLAFGAAPLPSVLQGRGGSVRPNASQARNHDHERNAESDGQHEEHEVRSA